MWCNCLLYHIYPKTITASYCWILNKHMKEKSMACVLPTRELTYPTWGIGKSSSKVPFFMGYVSSQEGICLNLLSAMCFSQLDPCIVLQIPTKETPGSKFQSLPYGIHWDDCILTYMWVNYYVDIYHIYMVPMEQNGIYIPKYIVLGSNPAPTLISTLFAAKALVIGPQTPTRKGLFGRYLEDYTQLNKGVQFCSP